MNKNRILFILLISFITMFGFKLDVYAAKELTCLYNSPGTQIYTKILLIQYSDGRTSVLGNPKDTDLIDPTSYWKESNVSDVRFGSGLKKGSLTKCPVCVRYEYQSDLADTGLALTVVFEDEKKDNCWGNSSLDVSKSSEGEVKDFTTSSGSMTQSKNGKAAVGKKCSELSTPWLNDSTSSKTLSCLYGKNVSEGCHIIQLDVNGTTGIRVNSNYGSLNTDFADKSVNLKGKFNETSQEVAGLFSGTCPPSIKVYIGKNVNVGDGSYSETFYDYDVYSVLDGGVKGNNLVTGDPASFGDYKDLISIVEINDTPKSCNEIIDSKMIEILHLLVNIFKILVPIILLVLGSLDLVQAVFSQDESGIKKAQGKFIKRLIIAVVIFLIPTILHVILLIANSVWSFIDPNLCGII